uniref:(northern house mosquito) hypothetical protein n=1 Tax=Culex pipiens TaxID=7175 RepID=A0A8D7ZVM1_CULPI
MPWRAAAANIDCSEAIVGGTPPPPVVAPRSRAASDLAEPAPCRRSTSRRSCSLLSLESLSESCRVWARSRSMTLAPGRTSGPDSGTSSPASFTVSSLPSTQK